MPLAGWTDLTWPTKTQMPSAFVAEFVQTFTAKPQKRLRGCTDSAKLCAGAGKLDMPQATDKAERLLAMSRQKLKPQLSLL